jgi:hypothetical protein
MRKDTSVPPKVPTKKLIKRKQEPIPVETDPRYKDWRSVYEADKKRGKGHRGK